MPLFTGSTLPTPFTVRIERRLRLLRSAVSSVVSIALLSTSFGCSLAQAGLRGMERLSKVARDLDEEVRAPGGRAARWSRDIKGVRHVQAIVVTSSSDPQMTSVREEVRKRGGTVQAVHGAMQALTVMIRASEVAALAQHSDVVSVSPNRETQRTYSTVEAVTGAVSPNARSYASKSSYTGADGTAVGIAVLDSGVMRGHAAFRNAAGISRVKRNVSMLNTTVANWTATSSGVSSLKPGSVELVAYEALVANDAALAHDGYGHGTHVASVAAGRYFTPKTSTAQDINGVAPNANIYDVKVLSEGVALGEK
jgi:subtilisin family serine protease